MHAIFRPIMTERLWLETSLDCHLSIPSRGCLTSRSRHRSGRDAVHGLRAEGTQPRDVPTARRPYEPRRDQEAVAWRAVGPSRARAADIIRHSRAHPGGEQTHLTSYAQRHDRSAKHDRESSRLR